MPAVKIIKFVAVNDRGHRIGSWHHNSTISDETVDKIREMHEDQGIGYKMIAKMMGLDHGVVGRICRYERRAQTIERFKKVSE